MKMEHPSHPFLASLRVDMGVPPRRLGMDRLLKRTLTRLRRVMVPVLRRLGTDECGCCTSQLLQLDLLCQIERP